MHQQKHLCLSSRDAAGPGSALVALPAAPRAPAGCGAVPALQPCLAGVPPHEPREAERPSPTVPALGMGGARDGAGRLVSVCWGGATCGRAAEAGSPSQSLPEALGLCAAPRSSPGAELRAWASSPVLGAAASARQWEAVGGVREGLRIPVRVLPGKTAS